MNQEISRCIRKFGITFDIDWKLIDALDEIEKLFKSEKIRRKEAAEQHKRMLKNMAQEAKDKEEAEKKRIAEEKEAFEKEQKELRDRRKLVDSKNNLLNKEYGFEPTIYRDIDDDHLLRQAFLIEEEFREQINKVMVNNSKKFGISIDFLTVYEQMEHNHQGDTISTKISQK